MIPSTQEGFDKAKELAARNVARGDWGEEVTIPGIDEEPTTPKDRKIRHFVSNILSVTGNAFVPKRRS